MEESKGYKIEIHGNRLITFIRKGDGRYQELTNRLYPDAHAAAKDLDIKIKSTAWDKPFGLSS